MDTLDSLLMWTSHMAASTTAVSGSLLRLKDFTWVNPIVKKWKDFESLEHKESSAYYVSVKACLQGLPYVAADELKSTKTAASLKDWLLLLRQKKPL